MTIVKEVLDGVAAVAKGVKNVREIAEAVREGSDYLKRNHAEASADVGAMLAELRKNLRVVARASAVLTNFRFAVASDTGSAELARFNDYFIKHKSQAAELRDSIDELRTHCSVVREHATNISNEAGADGFKKVFVMLGLRDPSREADLGVTLDRLAYEDFEVAHAAEVMLNCLDEALLQVQNALGEGGMMRAENISAAAAALHEYATKFETLAQPAEEAAKAIEKLVEELAGDTEVLRCPLRR